MPDGLTGAEARARLLRDGPNTIPEPGQPNVSLRLVAQMTHFFAAMLWVAAILAIVGGMPQLGIAIVIVILVNGIFAFVQEARAERATRALARLLPPTAAVVRDHREIRVEVDALVAGDIVVLAEGDRVPADATILDDETMFVDESLLTGESTPVQRTRGETLYAGTHVTSGNARVELTDTGARTRLGALARLTHGVVRRPTPIRVELDRTVRVMAYVASGTGAFAFVVALILGAPLRDAALLGVGVVVALVPEGLLPTLTLSMAMSARRMAGRGALVRHLEAVETLGETTVICTDKTGTLTRNEMTIRELIVGGLTVRATGTGYGSEGTLLVDGRPLTEGELERVRPLLRAGALCGNARIEEDKARWVCIGDPMEGALLALAAKAGLTKPALERAAPRVSERGFSTGRRRMSTLHVLADGAYELLVKGAPEAIMDRCVSVQGRPLGADDRTQFSAQTERLAQQGLRPLALARRGLEAAPANLEAVEDALDLLGVVGAQDPLRADVPDAVRACRGAGIRIVVVTGDHPATALAIASEAGLHGPALLGAELPDDPGALAAAMGQDVTIVARATPEMKLRITEALQARGDVVAVTGDGVNDAPALRRADIGVAMGRSGTDVAREASDLVLLDDSFAHIVEAIEEGRAAFENVRRFLTYHLTDNVSELTPFLLWAFSGGAIPLVIGVLQILALDIGTDLLPALALGGEQPAPGTMDRPPRRRGRRLIDRTVLGRVFGFLGPVQAALSMSMLLVGPWLLLGGDRLPRDGAGLRTVSTMVFASIVLMQCANVYACRSTPASLRSIGAFTNRLVNGAVLATLAILLIFVYVPATAGLLSHEPLRPIAWLPIVVTPAVFLSLEESRKLVLRHRGSRRSLTTQARRPSVAGT